MLTACSASAGASAETTFVVSLSAQPGQTDPKVPFSGSCLVSTGSGSESKTVDGKTPMSLTYRGRSISCTFQKQDADQTLFRASVSRSGVYQKQVDTTAQYGVLSFVVGQ